MVNILIMNYNKYVKIKYITILIILLLITIEYFNKMNINNNKILTTNKI